MIIIGHIWQAVTLLFLLAVAIGGADLWLHRGGGGE
ncbi:hypothetical protein NONO_c17570 [Nocardia nova SH22a]|uniref:Uncharacterized protein n=1 Tax=Nocardia nova SH22a TaxID=1415166 RepID=W5TBH3_9NOCA|nr:hypothetical protein NONO_c17570 [Nocardia nova SH22a]